jgi:hypothetical protein
MRILRQLLNGSACAVLFASLACSPKPTPIAYLPPLDRTQEGFLDPTTYQLVSFGRALDLTQPIDPKTTFFPPAVGASFDQEEFQAYNAEAQKLLSARKPVGGVPFVEVMAAEANRLNPQEVNLEKIDEKIRAPMEIKRALFDNACTNARILALYRWLIGDATQMKLLHGATLPPEGLQKTALDPRFFPPRNYYVAESEAILKDLEQAMAKKKFRYEIIMEKFSKPEQLECTMVIHIHRNNLQVSMPFLLPL